MEYWATKNLSLRNFFPTFLKLIIPSFQSSNVTDFLRCSLYALLFVRCPSSPAGLDTNPADVVAEMEGFRENLQLLIALKVMEILRSF